MVGVNLTGFFWLTQRAITEMLPWPGMTGWPTVGLHASSQEVPMAVAFPGESAEYRAARDRLLDQEIELRRAMEAVA